MMDPRTRWQVQVFSIMLIGYCIMFLCRKSFAYLIPAVVQEENLVKTDVGAIISCLSIAYAISKFIGGVLSDRLNSRFLFSFGLGFVGLVNITFSRCHSVNIFMIVWFLNGLGQGCGWPPCSKVLKQWFPPSRLGTFWGLLTSGSNIAGAFGPVTLSVFAQMYGWRVPMATAGLLCVLVSVVALIGMRNSPQEVGLPPIKEKNSSKNESSDSSGTINDVINSPFLWINGLSFFFATFQSGAMQDLTQLYLIQEKGLSQTIASAFISFFNIGGTVGNLSSGILTDRLVAKYRSQMKGNPRMYGVIFTNVIGIISLMSLRTLVSHQSPKMFILLMGFLSGFSVFSAINLNGVMVVESSQVHLSGTSHAIAALCANVGQIMAGYPLGYIASHYGWTTFITFIQMAGVIRLITMVAARNVPPDIGRPRKEKES